MKRSSLLRLRVVVLLRLKMDPRTTITVMLSMPGIEACCELTSALRDKSCGLRCDADL
jgi:hypothetical protein